MAGNEFDKTFEKTISEAEKIKLFVANHPPDNLDSIGRQNTNTFKTDIVYTQMKEAGIDVKKLKSAVRLKNMFEIWLKMHSTDEITEIQSLENIITLLKTDMASRVMHKLEKGKPLLEEDMKLIKLLKECLESTHELKYGKKTVNVDVSYEDIREMMFPEEKKQEVKQVIDIGVSGVSPQENNVNP